MANITGVYVDKNGIRAMEVEDTLDTWYDLLKCRMIDIVTRRIGENYYNIVCDDEGLLKDTNWISAATEDGRAMLVGNLFICKNESSELASISKEEAQEIIMNTAYYLDEDDNFVGCVVCDY